MNIESDDKEELKARRNVYLSWVAKIDEQIAELEKPKPKPKPKQWEPKAGSWCVFADGRVLDGESDRLVRSFGVERETKELAEQAAVAMRRFNRLLAYRDEFASGYIFQYGGVNCYVFARDQTWGVGSHTKNQSPAEVYFPEQVALELCCKLNSGEVLL